MAPARATTVTQPRLDLQWPFCADLSKCLYGVCQLWNFQGEMVAGDISPSGSSVRLPKLPLHKAGSVGSPTSSRRSRLIRGNSNYSASSGSQSARTHTSTSYYSYYTELDGPIPEDGDYTPSLTSRASRRSGSVRSGMSLRSGSQTERLPRVPHSPRSERSEDSYQGPRLRRITETESEPESEFNVEKALLYESSSDDDDYAGDAPPNHDGNIATSETPISRLSISTGSARSIFGIHGDNDRKRVRPLHVLEKRLKEFMDQRESGIAQFFMKFDSDHSGTIDMGEFRNCISELVANGFNEQELDKLCEAYDSDKSGEINYGEFINIVQTVPTEGDTTTGDGQNTSFLRRALTTPELKTAAELRQKLKERFDKRKIGAIFLDMDTDHSGTIAYREFRNFLIRSNIGSNSKDLMILIHEIDRNGDGAIRMGELVDFLSDDEKAGLYNPFTKFQDDYEAGKIDASLADDNKVMAIMYNNAEDAFKDLKERYQQKSSKFFRLFRELDDDKSGYISKNEFKVFMENVGMKLNDEQMEKLYYIIDDDRNDQIRYDEFCDAMMRDGVYKTKYIEPKKELSEAQKEEVMSNQMAFLRDIDAIRQLLYIKERLEKKAKNTRSIFLKHDSNRDGTIDNDEFKDILIEVGVSCENMFVDKLIKFLDDDLSGSINYLEFMNKIEKVEKAHKAHQDKIRKRKEIKKQMKKDKMSIWEYLKDERPRITRHDHTVYPNTKWITTMPGGIGMHISEKERFRTTSKESWGPHITEDRFNSAAKTKKLQVSENRIERKRQAEGRVHQFYHDQMTKDLMTANANIIGKAKQQMRYKLRIARETAINTQL